MQLHRIFLFVPVFTLVLALGTAGWAGVTVDEKVPDFSLKDIQGNSHSLYKHLKGDTKAVVVDFWSKNCPVSIRYDKRLKGIYKKYKDKGVKVLAIDSNYNESLLEIQAFAKRIEIPFPLLVNPTSSVATLYGGETTPQIFLIDSDGILRYTGSIDNDKDVGADGRVPHLENAIDQLLAGKTVETKKTRHFGCEIRIKN